MSSVSSAHDKFIVPWARKVQADSDGRIRIDIFPSMQLGGAPARLFDQARDGDADIVWTAPGLTPGRFPKIELFDLPFVPSRRALVSSKALQDFAALNLKDEFHEVHPLCFSCADRGVIHANAPIRTVEDVKDLKLHVATRLAGEAMNLLGAQPVPMPIGQLPLAINAHVIDGCLDPWHLMPALRLNDVLKTHTEFSDFSPSSTTFVLAMNGAAYDRLPRDLKAVIDGNSGQAAASLAGAMWDIEAGSVADTVVRGGDSIVTLLPEAVAHWRKLTEPVVDKWLKEMKEQKVDGGKLLASVHTLLVKYVNEPEPQPPSPPQQDSASPPQQTVSQPPSQAVTQQPPQSGLSAAPKINPPAPATSTPATPAPATPAPAATSSAAPSAGPVAKPVVKPVTNSPPPQPPPPRVAAPSPAPSPVPTPATIAKPVPPAAPAPPAAMPPSTATVAPAAKPAAVLAPTPAPPLPASPAISAVPAAKPAAAPVLAQPPAALAPTPPPTAAAAAPPPPAPMPAPVPAAPKLPPKSLDIPL
jgi:TRAP-type C4-dicarboxylate transport system substrate-binding protein